MPRWTRADLSSFYERRQNRAGSLIENLPTVKTDKTTDEDKLNKTERAFLAHLRIANEWVGIQCITLKIADDTRYTPDFWTQKDGRMTAWEVKGFFRDDAKVKIKVAARMFPWIAFVLVRKSGSSWNHKLVPS